MNPRQKRIVVILAIANIAVILALVVLVTNRSGARSSPPLTDHPVRQHHQPLPLAQRTCLWRATQLLARAGLGGTVTLTTDGPLRFEITYPLLPDQAVEEAAQAVWTAFDVALALQKPETGCAIFTTVDVTVLAHNDQPDTQVHASVSTADLVAFGAGEMSEDAFIERVTYSTQLISTP